MGGPPPKPAAKRRRRNVRPGRCILGAAPAVRRRPPALGRRPTGGAWLASTRTWWERVWRSPLADAWLDVDVFGLRRLALVLDVIARGKAESAALLGEARQLEDRYGLSPLSRRRLEYEVPTDGAVASERVITKPTEAGDGRWLRAVE